jgi:hypothetical protein
MSEVLHRDRLPAEAMNFLKAGTLKPTVERVPSREEHVEGNGTTRIPVARSTPVEAAPPRSIREKLVAAALAPTLVSMTFRLPADIPAGLIRAAADQKLKQVAPCSQQDIVAEALAQWLRKHGY